VAERLEVVLVVLRHRRFMLSAGIPMAEGRMFVPR
jgi:hypothetical protein